MSWIEARDRIATIIEETTPTTFAGGTPQSFLHFKEVQPDGAPDSRLFWLAFDRIAMKAPTTRTLPRRVRVPIDIVIAYRPQIDLTALYEVLAADWLAITTRLVDTSLWEQATSTIESLTLGSDLISEAEVDFLDDDAGVLLTIHTTAEFTA